MADYDLVVRGGTIVDGTGMPSYRGDVAVADGRIVAVGRLAGTGRREVDAEGQVVSPGFIDVHTHLDGQVFWDPLGTSACFHGVTTAVMGNCGFTLAPVRPDQRALVLANLERAEDIPAEALAEGVTWGFEHFREYLAVLEDLPKGINYAAYIGHSALRTWAMGERAFTDRAEPEDLAVMETELLDALAAGAVGFTTSRSANHVTMDDRPVASRQADWSEVVALVGATGAHGGGMFALSNESVAGSPDPAARAEYADRLTRLAVETGVPISFGVTSFGDPVRWREQLALLDRTAEMGGRMFGQSRCRESSVLYSFRTWLPFDHLPEWEVVRRLPLDEQAGLLDDTDRRARLAEAAMHGTFRLGRGPARPPDWDHLYVLDDPVLPNPSVAEQARASGMSPAELVIDLAVRSGFGQFFQQITGNSDPDEVDAILRHPRTVMTFSDSGAHVSQMINSSLQTHLLAYWVREKEILGLEEAVRMITHVPARAWGIPGRGLVVEDAVADLNVFDPDRIAPDLPEVVNDLPGGARRLVQSASGIRATIVAGQVVLADGEPTGALPGRLIRRHPRR